MSPCPASRLSAALAAFGVGLLGRCDFELGRERREAGHEAGARFRRTPPDPVIEAAEAVGVFDGERRLADPAHALHRRPADLGYGGGPLLGEDGVEPVELFRAARESRDARRDADERPAPSALRPHCRRTALGRRKDAASALLGLGDADEVLKTLSARRPRSGASSQRRTTM
jgi:hypothetical protein